MEVEGLWLEVELEKVKALADTAKRYRRASF